MVCNNKKIIQQNLSKSEFFYRYKKVIIFISHFDELSCYYYKHQDNFLVRTNLTVYKIIFFLSFLELSKLSGFSVLKNSNF